MANGLALIEEINTELAVIDSKKLAKISQRMVEIDRANLTAGKSNTQTTSSLMTLTMLCDGPYRRLRQVLAQIEKTRNAIEENVFTMRKRKVELRRLRESDDELDMIEADQLEHGMLRGKIYLEGALKELAMFQETYDEIKRTHNIPEDWDEVDMEKDEIANHIRMAFRNGIRNIMTGGSLGNGTLEYLEQFGIHPMTADKMIKGYIEKTNGLIEEGRAPTVDHLYEFLDYCAETFKDSHKAVMKRIGIEELIKSDYLYQELRDTA